MGRQIWKPGNMLYPLPAVLVSVADKAGKSNLFTVAWTGTVCSDPPMVSISVRPERYSYHMIEETGEFVVNLTTEELAYATDYCGVKSGREKDKWQETRLTPLKCKYVQAPMVAESPVNLECRVTQKLELGTHTMFLAEVLAVHVDESYLDANGSFHLNDAGLLVYSHGRYFGIGKELGTFGYSVRNRTKGKLTTDTPKTAVNKRTVNEKKKADGRNTGNDKQRAVGKKAGERKQRAAGGTAVDYRKTDSRRERTGKRRG